MTEVEVLYEKIRVCDEYKRFKSIIIFGASTLGASAYLTLKDKNNVIAFCDNDDKKHGTIFCGISVIPPNELTKWLADKSCAVLIASMYFGSISYQLSEMGIKRFFIYNCANSSASKASDKYSIRNPANVSIYDKIAVSEEQRCKNVSDFSNIFSKAHKSVGVSVNTGEINYYDDKTKNVLFIAYIFPPLGGSGVQRSSKFVKYLKRQGYNPIVVTALTANSYDFLPLDMSLMDDMNPETSVIRIDDEYYVHDDLGEKETQEACAVLDGIIGDSVVMNGFINDMRNYNKEGHRTNMFFIPWVANVLYELDNIVDFRKIGVIYSTSTPYFDHFIGFYLKKRYNIPWAADFRDEWTNNPGHLHMGIKISEVERRLEKSIAKEADALISVSEYNTENFSGLCGIPREKTYSITNGYDEDDFVIAEKCELSKPENGKLTVKYGGVVYLGDDPIDKLFYAVNGLIEQGVIDKTKLELQFFGNLSEMVLDSIRTLDIYGIASTGSYLEHIDSIRNMRSGDILLLLRNGKAVYSGKIFEYIRMGVPIFALAPSGGVIDELISATKTGVCCDPSDLESVKRAFAHMYKDFFDGNLSYNPNYDEIKKYSREELTRKLICVFEKIIAHGASS